ncbi:hypothetical protein [Desulfosporosinus sp. BG]|uniref:hypothetical protein n=1 Tax=Desulfosporosinus sp. BG TaxID=1633135 RepID=UPI00159F2F57|nr:hypothetical protein [Desulfosporosinus sp. BG]
MEPSRAFLPNGSEISDWELINPDNMKEKCMDMVRLFAQTASRLTSVYLEELTISERSFIIELSLILSENLGGAHEKKR